MFLVSVIAMVMIDTPVDPTRWALLQVARKTVYIMLARVHVSLCLTAKCTLYLLNAEYARNICAASKCRLEWAVAFAAVAISLSPSLFFYLQD